MPGRDDNVAGGDGLAVEGYCTGETEGTDVAPGTDGV